MFKIFFKFSVLFAFMICDVSNADDLEIYEGGMSTASAPVELVFALDTSTSMACGLDQQFNLVFEQRGCFLNVHQELLGDTSFLAEILMTDYEVPDNVKIEMVQGVMDNLLKSESGVLTDDIRVGLAFYNQPGGSIVQPLRRLGDTTDDTDYATHREMVRGSIRHIIPHGGTPILGTLLEIGQYLTSGQVIAGKKRADDPTIVNSSAYRDQSVRDKAKTYGETHRISSVDTILADSGSYRADLNCSDAITDDAILGLFSEDCADEELLDADKEAKNFVTYNEDINKAAVCEVNPDLSREVVTTQIVLITDGLSSNEGMEIPISDQRMGTWINRFVTQDADATGFLAAGEAFDQTTEEFPFYAKFTDLGCPLTARSTSKMPGSLVQLDFYEEGKNDFDTDADILGTSKVYPSRADQAAQYSSCVYNVANRFRELGVKIHVIGFALGQSIENEKLFKIAEITGGRWIDTSKSEDVEDFLRSIVATQMQSSSVSVPLSPNVSVNPGAILASSEEVYMPMFKAGATSYRYGNLRKYKMETKTKTIEVTDAEGETQSEKVEYQVLVGKKGEVTEECKIVEGEEVKETYTCFKDDSQDFWSDVPNGDKVTLGGAAAKQGVYGPDGRKVFIQHDDSLQQLALLDMDSDAVDDKVEANNINEATKYYYARLTSIPNVEASKFTDFAALNGHEDAATLVRNERSYDLLRWLAGFDKPRFNIDGQFNESGTFDERYLLGDLAPAIKEGDLANLVDSRQYMGAFVHSQPTVVNYGFRRRDDNTYEYDNVIFISGNDGFLRALDADFGTEEFSFFPRSLIDNIPAMFENTPGSMSYGLDSTWTAWRQDFPDDDGVFNGQIDHLGGKDFVRLYGGMRRGGNSYYVLDVTDRDDPDLLKEISRTTDTHFASLGQTWSEPVLAKIKLPDATLPTAVTIFGGGFDPAYDEDDLATASSDCISDTDDSYCGSQIFILDAGGYTSKSDTSTIGDLIWWASSDGVASNNHAVVSNMRHSIPSKVKTLDIDGDGLIDRVYVGDLGGQVFRIAINNEAENYTDFISISTLAQVGNEVASSAAEDNRVFFDPPSVAVMRNGSGTRYVGVSIASGWREKPKDNVVEEEFYFFRDTLEKTALATMVRPSGANGSVDFITHIEDISTAPDSIQDAFNTADAFALSLNADDAYPGEKAFGSPIILLGNAFFPSYLPPTAAETTQSLTTCAPPPQRSRITNIRLQSGSPQISIAEDGSVTVSETTDSELPVVNYTQSEQTVPLSGLGVHVGNDSVSILSGTKALNIAIDDDVIRKTRWENLGRGSDAVPDNAVGSETATEDENE